MTAGILRRWRGGKGLQFRGGGGVAGIGGQRFLKVSPGIIRAVPVAGDLGQGDERVGVVGVQTEETFEDARCLVRVISNMPHGARSMTGCAK